tara:strand:- start:859 stop:1434 length:576 start_codon:yes stop_codon:yes gene_type:complete
MFLTFRYGYPEWMKINYLDIKIQDSDRLVNLFFGIKNLRSSPNVKEVDKILSSLKRSLRESRETNNHRVVIEHALLKKGVHTPSEIMFNGVSEGFTKYLPCHHCVEEEVVKECKHGNWIKTQILLAHVWAPAGFTKLLTDEYRLTVSDYHSIYGIDQKQYWYRFDTEDKAKKKLSEITSSIGEIEPLTEYK